MMFRLGHVTWIPLAFAFAVTACSTNEGPAPTDASSADAGHDSAIPADADQVDAGESDAGTELLPCIPPAETRCDPGSSGETLLFVADSTRVARVRDERGADIIPGFNHDGFTSTSFDEEGCFFDDVTSGAPENEAGIDSQLGSILVDLSADDNLDDGFTVALEAGLGLLLIQVEGVDDRMNDDCVHVALLRGKLPENTQAPLLAGGRYEAEQMFDVYADSLDGDVAKTLLTDGRIENGRLYAGEANLDYPSAIRSGQDLFLVTFPFQNLRIRATLSDEGLSNAVVAGLLDVGATTEALDEFLGSNRPFFETIALQRADIRRNEERCDCTSAGLEITAVPAVRGEVVDAAPPFGAIPLSSL